MRDVRRLFMSILVGGFLVAGFLMPGAAALGQTGNPTLVKLTRIGSPAWTPVDLHVFTAPIGTAPNYAEFAKTTGIILPPPHYQPYQCLGIGPGTPEAPPYTHDIADGINNAGYRQGPVFAPQQFSNGQGVWLAYMVVPSPASPYFGSSPDFTSGPVIPNSLFPIKVNGVTDHNSAIYDPNLAAFSVPAITDPCVVPAFSVDGYSHFPIFLADNSDFGPSGTKLPGRYVYSVTMIDSTGNGWRISATFVVQ
jgi:hypothetical protein